MPDPLVVHNRYRDAQIELFGTDDPLTCDVVAGQAVTGGNLVELVTGGLLQVRRAANASAATLGVAMHSVGATDADRKLSVAIKGVWFLVADGTITSGQEVEASANGEVQTATTGKVIGTALNDATDGELVEVLLKGA